MDISKFGVLASCLTVGLLLQGCDKPKDNKAGVTSQTSSESGTGADTGTPGKIYYTPAQIKVFDLGGFNLDMSESQVKAQLASANWEGTMSPVSGDQYIEQNAMAFSQPNKDVAFFRIVLPSQPVKLYSIIYVQNFELKHDPKELADALIKKYGPPTDESILPDSGSLTWRAKPRPKKEETPEEAAASLRRAMNGNYQITTGEDRPIELQAQITQTQVRLTVTDYQARQDGEAAVKILKENTEKRSLKENGKSEEVKF